jgi:hypothetical protein
MLGARIELPARPAFDPIIVTLEKADPEFEKLDLEKAEPTVRSE